MERGPGTGDETGKQIGFYILCRTVHIALEWGTELDTIGFHTNFSGLSPGPDPCSVQCVCAISVPDNGIVGVGMVGV